MLNHVEKQQILL